MKFSLILPVYGVEKYIERCIESCCSQIDINPNDYEIIAVDDSSPDRSVQLARKIFEHYPDLNYRIISRPNGGLSAARNTGLENAKGEYVWFIDSDDYIEINALYSLNKILDSHPEIQVITFGHRNIYPNRIVDCLAPESLFNCISRGVDLIANTAFYSVCNRIYKREFIMRNGTKFKEGILWEDGEFNLRLLSVTEFHYCSPLILYNYLRRPNSISTANKISQTLNSDLYKFDSLSRWISEHHFSEKEIKILNQRNNETIIFMVAGLHQLSTKDRKVFVDEIKKRKQAIKKSFSHSAKAIHQLVGYFILFQPKVAAFIFGWKMEKLLHKEEVLSR